jgi:DNA repair protein RAD16
VSTSGSDSEQEPEEDQRLQRARKRQAQALKQANASKANKKPETKKKPEMKKKPEKKLKAIVKKKGAGKKGSPPDDSSTDDDHDPMDDIDMDRLIQEAMQGSQMSVLHSVCWFRIILDEAHMIKSRSSQTANASFSLIGIHRWCLSGTPLQNRVGELYSLIRFLRIDPMAHYFCRAKVSHCLATSQPWTKSFSIQLTFPANFSCVTGM